MTDRNLDEYYVKDKTCPAGWKDWTTALTSGCFEDKAMLPPPGTQIEVRWAPGWGGEYYTVERFVVTDDRPRKLKGGWTVVIEQTFGSFGVGEKTRLDELAQAKYEKPGTLVFGRKA